MVFQRADFIENDGWNAPLSDGLLFFWWWRPLARFLTGSHPIHVGIVTTEAVETTVKPAQPSGDCALLLRTIALPHPRIPRGVVRHVSGEFDYGTWGCCPMNERGTVRTNDALGEFGNHWVGKFRLAALPDVRSAVGRGRDRPDEGQAVGWREWL